MYITCTLLEKHNACNNQVALFAQEYPDGLEVTLENLMEAWAAGLQVLWLWNLLPDEGRGSKRAWALWNATQVQHLCSDPRVTTCLDVVRRKVEDPGSVSDEELREARAAAWAAWAAAQAAAQTAARDAARAAAWAAARAARDAALAAWAAAQNVQTPENLQAFQELQVACLVEMLENYT